MIHDMKRIIRYTLSLLLLMFVGVGQAWGQTYKYYALHANGKGYMKQRLAAVANDGTFRYENVYDGNGYSIWVYSSEGYLTNDMYYLCEANGTLILSDKPSTKWNLVDDGDKKRLQKQGTTKIVGLNSGGTPVLDEPTNLANKYAVCEMTVEENNGKWEGPKDVSYTVRSPQLVTFMRVYYIHNITATILKDDANKTNQKVVDKKDSRIFQRLKFKSTTDGNRGTSWDIDETNAVIYNKQASGDVTVKATYTLTSCDPIAANNHPAVDVDVTLKIQPAALTPDPAKNYLLFYTKEANYRFPYATNEMNEGDAVNPQGKKDVLADPDIAPNNQISWKVEVDAEGFVSFKNIETNRYVYYDASDFTLGSNYGVVKIGDTSLPSGDNRYKFRIYQPANHGSYGVCQTIIPYDLQFVVGRSDGDNGIINDGICCAWYVNKDQNIISLGKGNGDSKWKIYAYEAENRLKSDWTLNGPNTASETGTYNFTATTFYSRNIVGSPDNNRDLEIVKTYTKLPVKYKWTVTGINSYITTTDNSSNGDGKLAVAVNSMPVSNTIGAVKCEAYVDAGTYTLEVDGVTREFSVSKKLSSNKTVTFNLYPLSIVPTSFTEISSLSEITDASGYYKLTADCSDKVPASITEFTGWLDGDNHTISGLSAPLFAKMNGAAVVRNLMLQNVNISSSGKVGAIASEADGNARIYNVGILSGSVGSSDDYCGGIVGLIDGSARVINCYSYANITGGSEKGGIVGNNKKTSKQDAITTMVMNCMFYGDIADENTIAPIYGGTEITNASGGLPNYNFYRYRSRYSIQKKITKYNCALAMEEKFINRFERYRLLLNSNKKLAAWYITGNANDTAIIAKWVLETADRTISNPKPYPILKAQGKYPSIINYDAEHAPDSAAVGRFKGGRVGTLAVTISGIGDNASSLAKFTKNRTSVDTTLVMTDKDEDRFNFNYKKVQLPYFNEMGEGNCTKNRVVTGWEITGFKGRTKDTFDTGDKWGAYNFADRDCTSKDLYSKTGRVFSQGAYYDVPNGVTGITIKPHWATAAYVADNCYDVAYTDGYGADGVEDMGVQTSNGGYKTINGDSQKVYTDVGKARASMEVNGTFADGATVYDYAVVLVGNVHQDGNPTTNNTPYTIMSIDENKDNEPDYTYIFAHKSRQEISPIRFDFLNIMGIAEAQLPKNNDAKMTFRNVSIFKSKGWLEITNTCVVNFSQLEYDDNVSGKADAPVILLGGTYEQIVSTNGAINNKILYVHVGSNAWFAKFGPGTHSDGRNFTNHVPVSVTGGDYDEFYLTGTYQPNLNTLKVDSAECYVSGGRFGEMAGASLEPLKGSVRWDINYADITNFYGGGVNANKPVEGNIRTDIANSHVERFCGGPKFGDMSSGKTVTTNATNCTFGTFFGAGFGGNSYNRVKYRDVADAAPANYQSYYSDGTSANDGKDRGKYFDGGTTNASYDSGKDYGKKGKGVATDFDYEYFVWSTGQTGARFYVKFITFSLAKTNDVKSTLTKCTVNNNFYGGGSLGKVLGTATSILDDCTINGNVFGGGYSATIPKIEVRNTPAFKSGKEPNKNINIGMFEEGEIADSVIYEWKQVTLPNNGDSGMESTSAGNFVYTDEDLTTLGQVKNSNLIIKGATTVSGDVYGGGALASMDAIGQTKVTLLGGTINGDVYGGGQGRLEAGKAGEDGYVSPIAATVGSTKVNLNGMDASEYKEAYNSWGLVNEGEGKPYTVANTAKGCVVGGSIFGCNNINGTPLGDATVHVYKTQNAAASQIGNTGDVTNAKVKNRYDLTAVYGGGNLAAYVPTANNASTHVIIDGCDLTSIETVYGGGNAASTPATDVTVKGTFEIKELFGGGNGLTALPDGKPNPGANVGYKNYTIYEQDGDVWKAKDDPDYDTKEERTAEGSSIVYGTGAANVTIYGGTIHQVFGGSNTKGNVRISAVTLLEDQDVCEFCVDEAYGGGKSAPMDAEAKLLMSCIPGLKAAYGGAEAANIEGDVTLDITNGNFDCVFGGNNKSGRIGGTITVNIEETGCKPVIIGQLYGGGNQAPYTAPFVKDDGGNDTEVRQHGPTLNIKSFTSIGEVYGGGYGEGAVVTGDTYVNINEVVGDKSSQDEFMKETVASVTDPATQTTGTDKVSINTGVTKTFKDGDGDDANTISVDIPLHKKGEIGSIGVVFGGGNAAKVEGSTHVNIGTLSSVDYVTKASGESVARTGITPVGADIRGNVYGGGNNAEVTGDTHVVIGEKYEAPAPTPDPSPTPEP